MNKYDPDASCSSKIITLNTTEILEKRYLRH